MPLHQEAIDDALQRAYDRELLTDDGFREQLRASGIEPQSAILVKGQIKDVLDAKVSRARRSGMEFTFAQGYRGGKLTRIVLILDPSLPLPVRRQTVLLKASDSWDLALETVGILSARPSARSGDAYVECPVCGGGDSEFCPTCDGKGLVRSSDDD